MLLGELAEPRCQWTRRQGRAYGWVPWKVTSRYSGSAGNTTRCVAWAEVFRRGHEGYGRQGEASAYEGGATRWWLKVKQKAWTVEEDRWRRRISSGNGERWHLLSRVMTRRFATSCSNSRAC